MDILPILFSVLFVMSLLIIIQAGFIFATGSSDAKPIEMAKKRIEISSIFLIISVVGFVASYLFF